MKFPGSLKPALALALPIVLFVAASRRYVWLPSYLKVASATTFNIAINAVTLGRYVWLEGRVRGGVFRNWARRFRYRPQRIARPTTEEEIVELVKAYNNMINKKARITPVIARRTSRNAHGVSVEGTLLV
jgi:FAD/FMN-containing dehydrogenase